MDTFQVIIVLMTIKSNSGSIPLKDFYNDPSSTDTFSNSFSIGCDNSDSGQLHKDISNLRGDPSSIYDSYIVSNCLFKSCKHVHKVKHHSVVVIILCIIILIIIDWRR